MDTVHDLTELEKGLASTMYHLVQIRVYFSQAPIRLPCCFLGKVEDLVLPAPPDSLWRHLGANVCHDVHHIPYPLQSLK